MSRLDRLVSLLDTGTSAYVRNVAADQLADVQKSHPEELFSLLGRVVPFLRSSKWDTRTAAARAIGLIVENAEWSPESGGSAEGVEHVREITEEVCPTKITPVDEHEADVEIKKELGENMIAAADGHVMVKDEFASAPETNAGNVDKPDVLTFASLDIRNVLIRGSPLLGSAGKEYDIAMQNMDPRERLKVQQQNLKRQLGFATEFSDGATSDLLLDDDLDLAPPKAKAKVRGRPKAVKKEESPQPEPSSEPTAPPMNARMRALAKRKARFGPSASSKVQVLDVAPKSSDEKVPTSSKVVVEHRDDKSIELTNLVAVKDSHVWPYESLCEILMADMFSPSWEVRHGALLGLRELLRSHGSSAGMESSKSKDENSKLNAAWLEDLACRLCCILALDRFADYVADEVVAPVRESCAQTLGVLFLHLPIAVSKLSFDVLKSLVLQKDLGLDSPAWAASHGAMLGMMYIAGVRADVLENDRDMFSGLVECVFEGLENDDDDVQAIAAATLLPIAGEFVEKRSEDIERLLTFIWDALAGLRDELSTSIGHVMDLLAKLCSYQEVLDIMVQSLNTSSGTSFATLVPRLYPFLRHSIVDVRKAVLRSLRIFLTIQGDPQKDWVDLRCLRLIFQNIVLEQNDAVARLSVDLWNDMLELLSQDAFRPRFNKLFDALASTAFSILVTPIGTSRRFYKIDVSLLIKPSGAPYEREDPGQNLKTSTSARVNIDGPILDGDVLIVDPDVFIRNKINASNALGNAMALGTPEKLAEVIPSIFELFDSPMSTQQLTVFMLLEEFGKAAPPLAPDLLKTLNASLLACLDRKGETIYRDVNPILRAVRTQCQSLYSLMVSQGKLASSAVPQLASVIEGDANAGPYAFNIKVATELAGPTFLKLKAKLSTEAQVVLEQTLEEARINLNNAIDEAKESLEKRNISIKSAAAAAYLRLNEALPTKLNPIIRSLMDSIKSESNQLLHDRGAENVAQLVQRLREGDRIPAASKMVKNLCSFLCVDVKEAPMFHPQQDITNEILSLKKDEVPLKDISEVLRKQRESQVVFIKRNGALLALGKLAKHYGSDLFSALEEVPRSALSALQSTDIAALPENVTLKDDTTGQAVIDSLAVVRAILPYLDVALHSQIAAVLPSVRDALFCRFSVIRFVAAKCLSTVCKAMPTVGISFLVQEILPKINAADDLHSRQGSIEAIYHLMVTMGEQVLPYIVFFIVPTLGRMSDSDHDIRTIAATAFASIIKLVPLESGIQDPPDMPQSLLEGRDMERKFISQMMDISKVEPFKLPITVKAELRKYQQEGVNWLAFLNKYHLHGVLCDDMGLGKTLQTICIVASDHHMRAEQFKKTKSVESRQIPSLIICPTSLTGHWVQEFKKYVPTFKTLAYVGYPTVRSQLVSKFPKVDVVITSYDIARNDVETLSPHNWNYCVLDEGHIIKNANSKLSIAVKRYISNHRLVLSGTPIQNDVLELWSLFDFLMPGFLGSAKSFNERFSKPIIASKNSRTSAKEQEAAALALEALHKQVLPFLLRRLKEDVLNDLPPKIIQDYYCDLNDKQKKLYDVFTKQQRSIVEEDLKDKGNASSKTHIFQALLYLRRLCNHPALVTYTKDELAKVAKDKLDYSQSPKLLALEQLLQDCGIGDNTCNTVGEVPEIMSQHRALIFCQQKDMLDLVENSLLKAHMPTVSYMRLDGSVPGTQRHDMVAKFNDDPSIDVLLLSTHVGGLGLNLTGADTVIFVEHDWNPMNDLQAMDRAHRIGQKKVVNVYRLITRNTLEERIMGLQEFKMNIASTVINQQNSGLMSMDTDQILDLFNASSDGTAGSEDPEPKGEEETAESNASGVGGKEVIAGLGELWDEREYAEEYNLDNFIKNIKKK